MKFSLRGHHWVLTAPLLLLAPACGGGDKPAGGDAGDSVAAAAPAPPPPAPAPAGTLTDGNIVAILGASGRSEIVPSQAVVDGLHDARVKQFANLMITQHTALNDTVTMVARQNNITPAPNPASAALDSVGAAEAQRLKGLSGTAQEREFMQYMVQSHQAALDSINQRLLPAVQHPQLRNAVQQYVLPVVRTHLTDAKALLSSLGSP